MEPSIMELIVRIILKPFDRIGVTLMAALAVALITGLMLGIH